MNDSTVWWLVTGALVAAELMTGTFYLLMLAIGAVAEPAERRAANAGYRAPAGKPDKRARRLIQALGDLDSL